MVLVATRTEQVMCEFRGNFVRIEDMNELDTPRSRPRRMRADAARNRQQILRAAADLIIESGPTTPMDNIARRAQVGIATLYRHFPDRSVLLREVALDTLRTSAAQAREALAAGPDAFTALARYMHDSIDLRIGAVMSLLVGRIPMDDELMEARMLCRESNEALAVAAHQEGSLRPDVTTGDISMLIMRFTPTLPGTIPAADTDELRHRHLELLVDGLLRFLKHEQLPGPAMSFDHLVERGPVPGQDYARFTEEARARERARWFGGDS
jgi:AcrR family transcriptional regulator